LGLSQTPARYFLASSRPRHGPRSRASKGNSHRFRASKGNGPRSRDRSLFPVLVPARERSSFPRLDTRLAITAILLKSYPMKLSPSISASPLARRCSNMRTADHDSGADCRCSNGHSARHHPTTAVSHTDASRVPPARTPAAGPVRAGGAR
jgi:hypothetical protein